MFMGKHSSVRGGARRFNGSALIIMLAGCNAAFAQAEYEFIAVPSFNPGLGEAYLWDINESNVAVGAATKTNTIGYPPFFWTEAGGKTQLPTPTWPRGISNSGWIVGVAQSYNVPSAQAYTPNLLPGTYPILQFGGVNDAGIAVGHIQTCNCSNSGGVLQVPLIWSLAGGSSTINVPGAKGLSRINGNNRAIGWLNGSSSLDAFYIDIDSGQYTVLSDIFPPIGFAPTRAFDINDNDQIVGSRFGAFPVTTYGYVFDPDTGFEVLPFPGASYQQAMTPFGINNHGTIVGDIFLTNGSSRAFVYTKDKGVRALNDPALVSGIPAGFTMTTAQKINDNGWIVGYGTGGTGFGFITAYVLRPVGQACYADCDGSGSLDFFDFLCFQNKFAAGAAYADCDGSGTLDFFDFLCFQNGFAAGCP